MVNQVSQPTCVSKSGLRSARMLDIDISTPRPPLPSRALPDDVRAKLRLPDRAGGSTRAPLQQQQSQQQPVKGAAAAAKPPFRM
jgi:hypothetical protein